MFWNFLISTNFSFFFKNSKFFFVLSYSKNMFFIQKVCFCLLSSHLNPILHDFFSFKSYKKKDFFFNVRFVIKSLFIMHYFSNFFFKKRFRLSGLGYGLELLSQDFAFFKFLIGFSQIPLIRIPVFIRAVKTNRKKKKISIFGFRKVEMNFFAAKVRDLRPCDSYKQKGVRLRFEKIFLKEGKRGLRR